MASALGALEGLNSPEREAVAYVNREAVPLDRFNHLYQHGFDRAKDGGGPLTPGFAPRLKRQLALKMIDDLLVEQAARASKLVAPAAELDARWASFTQQFPSDHEHRAALARFPDGEADVRRELRLAILRDRLADIGKDRLVPDAEVKRLYDQNRTLYDFPESLDLREVLLRVPSDLPPVALVGKQQQLSALRDDVVRKVRDVAAVARASSDGPTARVGGVRVRLTADALEPGAWKAVNALKPGQLTDVLRIKEGLVFYELVQRRPKVALPYEEIAPALAKSLERSVRAARHAALLADLRSRAEIIDLIAERYPEVPDPLAETPPPPAASAFVEASLGVSGAPAATVAPAGTARANSLLDARLP